VPRILCVAQRSVVQMFFAVSFVIPVVFLPGIVLYLIVTGSPLKAFSTQSSQRKR
jgi:hypothetical protein